ncbi:hypothetical protein MN116_009042 [Schistosoma mekongi]|uniref:Uncharacterized protein n=1 Tax=Schistosoma mekongi TaxID=38744 RepID=A0AAE1Z480_SCHME|nr:hypothetical protein MN116_009042 [Schistosoma mekongi]
MSRANKTSTSKTSVECHNNSTFTNCGYIRNVNNKSDNNNNNNSSHYQSFESVDHFILDNDLNDDASGYLFLSTSSSSSASSCIHIPSASNDSTTTTTTTTAAATTNNNNNSCCADCHVENNALSTSTINRMLVSGEENDNHCQHHRYHEGPSVHHQYQRQDSELIRLTMHNCIPLPIMLIPTSELASGDSLTCTFVNILGSVYDNWKKYSCHNPISPLLNIKYYIKSF